MSNGKRSRLWTTALLLLLALTALSAAVVRPSDIARLKAKVEARDMLSAQDIKLAGRINATTGSYINVPSAIARAKEHVAGVAGHPRRPQNPLDDYAARDTTYAWVDISTSGTAVPSSDDGNTGPYDIGFSFPFYGNTYGTVRVCMNGFLTFGGTSMDWTETSLPTTWVPNNAIYAFWDDLDTRTTGQVKYYADAVHQRFIVSWIAVPHRDTNEAHTFEVILFPNGNILFQYQTVPQNVSCTAGIENASGTQALQICYDGTGELPANGLAILVGQPDGIPERVTQLTATYSAPNVVLTWADPTHDTNGNPLTPDSILIYLGGLAPEQRLAQIAPGVQAFTHANAPQGSLIYYVQAKHDTAHSAPSIVPVLAGNPVYHEDLDVTDGMWVADNDVWQWGTPTNPGGPEPHSGTGVWAVGLHDNYGTSVCGHLDLAIGLPVVDAGATLEFWYWYQIESPWDGCNVKASVDGGNTWQPVTPQDGYTGTTNGEWMCGGNESCWSGSLDPAWRYAVIPIGQFIGQTPIFRLTFGSDGVMEYAGYYMDDVVVWGLQPVVGVTVSGTLTLDGGNGNVTLATVRADGLNSPSAHPNASGAYTLANVQTGNRVLSAHLAGYQTITSPVVVPAGGLTGQNLTLRRGPVPVPTGLTVSVSNATGEATLAWDVSPDPLVDDYRVYRKLREDTAYTLAGTYTGTGGMDLLTVPGIYDYVMTARDVDVTPPALESAHSAAVQVLYGALPPQRLHANGNYDDHIRLSWFAPGVPPEQEVFYDDGTNEVDGLGWWGSQPPFGWIVSHFAGNGPVTVTRVKIYSTNSAIAGNSIQIGTFADDGMGQPTLEALGVMDVTQDAPLDQYQEWVLDPPVTFDNGSFFVGIRQVNTTSINIGADITSPFVNNAFFYNYDGQFWTAFEPNIEMIPMERAVVVGDMGNAVELLPSPVCTRGAAALASTVEKSAWRGAVARTAKHSKTPVVMNPAPSGRHPSAKAAHYLAERAMAPNATGPRAPHVNPASSPRRRPGALDDVVRYHIIRDNVLHDSVDATRTLYDDVVAEGTAHTYQVSAFYDDGTESGRTNSVTTMAAMAPGAPAALTPEPDGIHRMRLTWRDPVVNRDGTPCIDHTNCRIYRDGTLLGTAAHGVQEYLDTPPSADSMYTWTVSALDEAGNEGPAAICIGSVLGPWMQTPYEWTDISTIGANTGLTGDDETTGPFALGFPFEFYGTDYSDIYVCSNGFASFDGGSSAGWSMPIPNREEPNCALYPYWDNLYLPAGGQVMYYSDAAAGRFIISWLDVSHLWNGTHFSFQIVLKDDGSVTYNYLSIPAENQGGLVGVENCDGTAAYQVFYENTGLFVPHDSSSVVFWRGASTFAPVTGHVSLDGGTGSVPAVTIRANGAHHPSVHPATNGDFVLDSVQIGDRRIRASLTGYDEDTLSIALDTNGYTGANFVILRSPPPAPTNVTGTVRTIARKDSLHWDVCPDLLVDGYRVYRKLLDGGDWTVRQTVTGRTQNWMLDTLEANGVYQYSVRAIDNNVLNPPLESGPSNVVTNPFGPIPPQMLSANGHFDNRIRLSWIAPGVPPEVEAFYDDGTDDTGGLGWGSAPPFGWLVAHYQGVGAITVTRIKTYFTQMATPGAPIQIGVFADDGAGHPTFEPLGVNDTVQTDQTEAFQEWSLSAPVTFDNGSFYVGIRQLTDTPLYVGGDATTPFINNTFFYSWDGTVWNPYEPGITYIPMQRCFVIGDMGGGLRGNYELAPAVVRRTSVAKGFGAHPSKVSMALQSAPDTQALSLRADSRTDKKQWGPMTVSPLFGAGGPTMPAWQMAERLRTCVAPHAPHVLAASSASRGRGGRSLDDIIRYVIFRDDAPRDSVAPTITRYDDTPLPENQPHSYVVRARYDDNGLSLPSNTATAVCAMAPAAPTNLALTSVGESQMRLTWTDPMLNADGSTLVDLAGIRVYRDDVLVTPTPIGPGVGQFMSTPPDPAIVYTWTVKAVDEVPNESAGASATGSVISPWHTIEYQWVDISATGTPIVACDDCSEGPYDLGFNFSYYGQTFTTVNVTSNGFVQFSGMTSWTSGCPPTQGVPDNAIYLFGADLNPGPSGHGQVLYYADAANQRCIISWNDVPRYMNSGSFSMQVILDSRGGITLNYQALSDNFGIVGVENADGTDGVSLWCQSSGDFMPVNNSSVKFWGGPQQALTGTMGHLGGTNPPLEDGHVWVTGLPDTAYTDAAGHWILPVDPGVYTVHFGHSTHCDSARANVAVEANVNTTVNVLLRSPAAALSVSSLTFVVHRFQTQPQAFTISNSGGNCPLTFQIVDSVNWLSSNPSSGTVNPNGSTTVTVTAAPGQLQPNEYATMLRVYCNAPGSPFLIQADMNVLSVDQIPGAVPTEYALHANYPNPFNPTTLLPFDVPQNSQVAIIVYNVMGQEVATLVNGKYAAGRYQVAFDGEGLPSGLYLVKMTAGSYAAMNKMMLLK
ncbi:MAG TPA: T9SS type A sorting domain-containing protein [bacterium]|jgi:hypothetical protein